MVYEIPEIHSIANEQRYAVVSKLTGNIIVIAPSESYCNTYCSRANEDFTTPRYEVKPYNEKERKPRHLSSLMPPTSTKSIPNPVWSQDLEEYDIFAPSNENIPFNKNFNKKPIKERIQEYLSKKS